MAKTSIIDAIVDVLEELECAGETDSRVSMTILGEALAKDLGVSRRLVLDEIKSAKATRCEQHARASMHGLGLSASSKYQNMQRRQI
ncbi:hypothetical protein V8J82_14200 [Gymnodinialimonas sp. 2305UL16-5]|uniref:hypothetical protein n=1 Tax=Gymnodinialimonas mytili TaxID=3126503 RepID=UPI0030ABABB0